MTRSLRAVLFDFDGTLWDSEAMVFRVMAELYREHGFELTLETWSSAIGTVGGFDPYGELHALTGGAFDLEDVSERTEARIREAAADVPLRPGVDSFLRQVDTAGLSRALVSSDTTTWISTNLERLGWAEGWAAVVCANGTVEHAKPSPHLYLAAIEALDVAVAQTFAVEDSPNGIRAAKAAGIPTIAVPNEVTARLDLSEADLVFPSLEGLSVEGVREALSAIRP